MLPLLGLGYAINQSISGPQSSVFIFSLGHNRLSSLPILITLFSFSYQSRTPHRHFTLIVLWRLQQQNVHWRFKLGYHRWYIHCPFCTHLVAEVSYVEGLRDYFSQFGKVDACTIMRDAAGRSRCFAFLTFEDPASVNAVMVREHVLDGKIVSEFLGKRTCQFRHSFGRLIQRGLSQGKNINEPRNYSLVVSQVA
jgi:hypothetical protein